MNFLVDLFNFFCFKDFVTDTEVHRVHQTYTVCTMQIDFFKRNTTKRFIESLEVEQPGYTIVR